MTPKEKVPAHSASEKKGGGGGVLGKKGSAYLSSTKRRDKSKIKEGGRRPNSQRKEKKKKTNLGQGRRKRGRFHGSLEEKKRGKGLVAAREKIADEPPGENSSEKGKEKRLAL